MPRKYNPFTGELDWEETGSSSVIAPVLPGGPPLVIPSGVTKDLDVVPLVDFSSATYFMHFAETVNSLHYSLVFGVSRKGAADITDTVSSELADLQDILVNAVISGADVKIQATNGGAESVNFTGSKITH